MSTLVTPSYRPPVEQFDSQLPRVRSMRIALPRSPAPFPTASLRPTTKHEVSIREQIGDLAALRDGWLDGTGKAFEAGKLALLEEALATHYPAEAPELSLYPTGDGNVQAEWWIGEYHAALEVFFDGTIGAAEWSDYHFPTEKEQVREVNISRARDWQWVARRLLRLG